MKIAYDDVHDIITMVRIKVSEDDMTPEEALDEVEKELDLREIEDF